MDKKTLSLVLAAGLLGAGSVAAVAEDQRNLGAVQERQEKRIDKGVADGELSHHEARKLRREERDVGEERREAMSDGHVDRHERHEIRQDQKRLNEQIYHERHDGD